MMTCSLLMTDLNLLLQAERNGWTFKCKRLPDWWWDDLQVLSMPQCS